MTALRDRIAAALVDRYRVLREIGSGGMAVVFLVADLKHDRQAAIKVLRPEIAAELGTQRFLQEIRITARLSHPHILPLLDSGVAGELPYYVMPLVEGETLREKLTREVQLPLEAALAITRQIASALTYAHGQGILHRDVKPENILITQGGAQLADFGIAGAVAQAGGDRLTLSGVAIGTPAYMSPEQALAERRLDARTDQYALAAVLYEMLAGELPFAAPTVQALVARRLTESPRPLRATRPGVTDQLENAVARALAREAADRFASVADFVAALGHDASAPATPRGARRRQVAWLAAAALVLMAVVVLPQRFGVTPRRSGVLRLAVLPLANLGGPEDDPFAGGLTEEIANRLIEIEGLQVVSRTSALRFKNRDASLAEIGAALKADFLLEGTVRSDRGARGGTARVTPQLVRVADDVRLWQHQYDVPLTPGEIFGAQARIAAEVAAALNLQLGDATRRRIARVATPDSAAYRLFQLGRFHWERRDAENLRRAAGYFSEAITRDSVFADAYAGLADATNALVLLYGTGRDSAGIALARRAAHRAVALDSSRAPAHAALGFVQTFFDWDWANAESSLTRAIQLDPQYGPARYWYTQLLWFEGRIAAALEQAQFGIENDPLSGVAHLAYARTLRLLGSEQEWIKELRRTIELQPGIYIPYLDLAEHYAAIGQREQTVEALRAYVRTAFPERRVADTQVRHLAAVLERRADPGDARRVLARAGIAAPPGLLIRLFALGGARDSAFSALSRAIAARHPDVVMVMPFIEPLLHDDARWVSARAQLGMAPGPY